MPIHVRAEPGDYAEACLLPGDLPEVGDRTLFADQHPRPRAHGHGGEGAAARPGRDDVRTPVAERYEAAALLEPAEAPEAAAGDVLKEDALDRVPGAVLEDLPQRRLDDVRHPSEFGV